MNFLLKNWHFYKQTIISIIHLLIFLYNLPNSVNTTEMSVGFTFWISYSMRIISLIFTDISLTLRGNW